MSWRNVIIQNRAKLDLELGSLVVRGEETVKVHISEISVLLIENTAVSLTAALLSELTKRKIKVIFCDEKRSPISEIVPYYGSHDTSSKIREQVKWSDNVKCNVWIAIVSEKIAKQAEHLQRNNKEQSEMLYKYIDEIQACDKTNREGHAAKVYFNALFGLNFTRDDDSSINAALNYGYAILLSAFNREIVSNGYITQLGLFHDNMFNQYNLSSDLMEPYRTLIDEIVYSLDIDEFLIEHKHILVDVLNHEIMIGGKKQFVNNAIKIYVASIFQALNNNDIKLIEFYENI